MAVVIPSIPETITVHLGKPDDEAPNVTVPFIDYVKNVASSEIYPTWPDAALRANIYAIITFALNRIYTEWYRSQGYDFDITNSTQFDQAYVPGRDIFENISDIVGDLFNDYVVRQGSIEPYFTQFCNGTTVKCNGLSQWGTVTLAKQGLSPYEILQRYYGNDISLVRNAPVQNIEDSYPGTPLIPGMASNEVKLIQTQLNRIARNYPAIPTIDPVNGIYLASTTAAVRKFQEIFGLPETGTVDKATWYRIKRYYIGVKRLAELVSEGLSLSEATTPYPSELSLGMRGNPVLVLQYYLNTVAYFNPSLSIVPPDGIFGSQTETAVKEFQKFYGLPQTGVVYRATWARLVHIYHQILQGLPSDYQQGRAKLYPGEVLGEGMRGEDVRDLQQYLAALGENISELPVVPVTGFYGPQTRNAVLTFQRLFGLPLTGAVGPLTWYFIAQEYDALLGLA